MTAPALIGVGYGGIRIVSRDGATVRHTVKAIADYSSGAEWSTSLRNKAFLD